MNIKSEYYFSKTKLIIGTVGILFMVVSLLLGFYFFIISLPRLELAMIALGFILIMGSLFFRVLHRFFRFLKCYMNNIPALKLTKESLEDNINERKLLWNEIAIIKFHEHNIIIVTHYARNKKKPSWFKNPLEAYEYHYKDPHIMNTWMINEDKEVISEQLNNFYLHVVQQSL